MLDRNSTLAIILGVSECPRARNLNPVPQCKNSATDFQAYLVSQLGVPTRNIFNIFDSSQSASDQLDQIEDWLARKIPPQQTNPPTDLILYYSGHGGFSRNDQAYFLAVYKTRDGSEGATSIRYIDLASVIKRRAASLRKYLILDCCFAASAILNTQADLTQMVVKRVEDELPPSGTAVLCSSAAKMVSIAPPGERHTMFSGALLKCLRSGVPGGPKALTLEDAGNAIRRMIVETYPTEAVRPELHVPDQARGNPATVPLFPNPSWRDDNLEAAGRKEPAAPLTPRHISGSRFASLVTDNSDLVFGGLAGLASTLSYFLLSYPIGNFDRYLSKLPSWLPPTAPAILLVAGLLLAAKRQGPLDIKAALSACIFAYPCWLAAWNIVYAVVPRVKPDFGSLALILSSVIAGFVGSFFLSCAIGAVRFGYREFRKSFARTVARDSVVLGLWGGVASIHVIIASGDLSASYLLGLFVPWQMWYIRTATALLRPTMRPMSKGQLIFRGIGSIALVGILLLPPVKDALNSSLAMVKATAIALSVSRVEAQRFSDPKFVQVTVDYDVRKTIRDSVDCQLELKAGGYINQAEPDSEGNTTTLVETDRLELTTRFLVLAGQIEDNGVRLICTNIFGAGHATSWEAIDITAPQ